MASEPIVAAGCLITRGSGADVETVLVHRPKYDDWSLPKGKQDQGEHVIETAVREVREETGLTVALRRPLHQRSYQIGGEPKVVSYWHAEVITDNGFEPSREVDDVKWLPLAAAVDRSSHELDMQLISAAAEPPGTPFVLLRHGRAVKRAAWKGDDLERLLDPSGETQAKVLVRRLQAYGVRRIHASAARRCVQTVEPYSAATGMTTVIEPALTEEGFRLDPTGAKARIHDLVAQTLHDNEPTVFCGHRPYLPELIEHLLAGSGLEGPQGTVPVGSMIVLHTDPRQHVLAVEHHKL